MFKKFCIKVGRFLASEYISDVEARAKDFELKVNQRVAEYIGHMDPFQPLMKEFHGIFSDEFEHPEEKLDDRSRIGFLMWAYQQKSDPSFRFMTEWIMNSQANETLKRAPVTPERIQYGRAQISTVILFKREIGRLALLYEEILAKQKGEDIDIGLGVE